MCDAWRNHLFEEKVHGSKIRLTSPTTVVLGGYYDLVLDVDSDGGRILCGDGWELADVNSEVAALLLNDYHIMARVEFLQARELGSVNWWSYHPP